MVKTRVVLASIVVLGMLGGAVFIVVDSVREERFDMLLHLEQIDLRSDPVCVAATQVVNAFVKSQFYNSRDPLDEFWVGMRLDLTKEAAAEMLIAYNEAMLIDRTEFPHASLVASVAFELTVKLHSDARLLDSNAYRTDLGEYLSIEYADGSHVFGALIDACDIS